MPPDDLDALLQADAQHVWHPYAPMPAATAPYVVASAQGTRLTLADGRELIDGMSSWWAAIHGYRHPRLDAAITTQLDRMAHVMFGGLTHEPAIRLAEKLVAITPDKLQHVFFADSGSVAVEVAVKMAVQRWRAAGDTSKSRLLTIRGGYHGDTFMAMSVCDPVGGMHSLFTNVVAPQVFADRPPAGFDTSLDDAWLADTELLVKQHAHELAAVIIEPVVQGAGGMHFYSPDYVAALRELCDRYDVLLILDEIATGFGRTGAMFAAEHAGVQPDILCLGKALTGGYLSLAATLCTAEVAHAISEGVGGALMHGPTFMGNPLATAVAGASIDLLLDSDWQRNVRRIESGLRDGLAPLAQDNPNVADVRVLGAIGVVQLTREVDLAAATKASVDKGVWLRPFRDLVYTMPPYISTDDDVAQICAGVAAAVTA
ncbi:MAG: adenosylmethionine--8-amino-7-oxononanoate transaminase [Frankiaceae bacterium]|nr:adenosylmethionine--8-amino-7-oxononanoate transaminase [Frankiaceae bacterium]